MACCSERKTVHVFNVQGGIAQSQMVGDSQTSASEVSAEKEEESKEVVKNTKSKLKMFSGFMPYYGKEFSFCQLTCSDNSTEQVCFIEKGKLVLITNQGKLYHS